MTKDICFLSPTNSVVSVPLVVTGTCEGAIALLQKVVLLVFSDNDEIIRPEGGSAMNLIGAAGGATEASTDILKSSLLIALKSVEVAIQSEQSENTELTDSERLASIELEDFKITGDSIEANIAVSTQAGNELQVTIPISIAEGGL